MSIEQQYIEIIYYVLAKEQTSDDSLEDWISVLGAVQRILALKEQDEAEG